MIKFKSNFTLDLHTGLFNYGDTKILLPTLVLQQGAYNSTLFNFFLTYNNLEEELDITESDLVIEVKIKRPDQSVYTLNGVRREGFSNNQFEIEFDRESLDINGEGEFQLLIKDSEGVIYSPRIPINIIESIGYEMLNPPVEVPAGYSSKTGTFVMPESKQTITKRLYKEIN